MHYIPHEVYMFIEVQMLYICLSFRMLIALVCGLGFGVWFFFGEWHLVLIRLFKRTKYFLLVFPLK